MFINYRINKLKIRLAGLESKQVSVEAQLSRLANEPLHLLLEQNDINQEIGEVRMKISLLTKKSIS